MIVRRFPAGLFVMAGVLTTLTGIERQLGANCMQQGPYYPAVCVPAHQAPPPGELEDPPPIQTCDSWLYFWCVPSEGSDCGITEGYGEAVPGYCEHYLGEQVPHACMESTHAKIVVLLYHRSTCMFLDGVCQCAWILGEHPGVAFPVCDCSESPAYD